MKNRRAIVLCLLMLGTVIVLSAAGLARSGIGGRASIVGAQGKMLEGERTVAEALKAARTLTAGVGGGATRANRVSSTEAIERIEVSSVAPFDRPEILVTGQRGQGGGGDTAGTGAHSSAKDSARNRQNTDFRLTAGDASINLQAGTDLKVSETRVLPFDEPVGSGILFFREWGVTDVSSASASESEVSASVESDIHRSLVASDSRVTQSDSTLPGSAGLYDSLIPRPDRAVGESNQHAAVFA